MEKETNMLPHKDGGLRCLVAHSDAEGNPLPACIVCRYCGAYVRPEKMNEPCPARNPKEKENG